MGDLNGQIGICDNPTWVICDNRGIKYTYGHGKRTKNGARLVKFALQNKLSILNSFFKKNGNKEKDMDFSK